MKQRRQQTQTVFLLLAASFLLASCATNSAVTRLQDVSNGNSSAETVYLRSPSSMGNQLRLASPALLASQIETGMLLESGYAEWRKTRLKQLESVQALKIKFSIPGENGETQSGMLFLPAADKKTVRGLSWVVYCKGTEIPRDNVPSGGKGLETAIAATLAALGNAVWMPDYEGMGDSPGIQTYCVPDRLAASALVGLAAARRYVSAHPEAYEETGRLYVMGYSEGGLAAMATVKKAAEDKTAAAGLDLTAAYPMGAPLNLMIGMDNFKDIDPVLTRPEYQMLLVLGWARAYPRLVIADDILSGDLLKKVLPLFMEGILDNGDLHKAIAESCGKKQGTLRYSDIFRADYLDALGKAPDEVPYYRVQLEHRLDRWVPPAGLPVFLAATESDTTVNPANSHNALAWMRAHGDASRVTLIRLLSESHAMAGGEALLWAVMDIDRRESAVVKNL